MIRILAFFLLLCGSALAQPLGPTKLNGTEAWSCGIGGPQGPSIFCTTSTVAGYINQSGLNINKNLTMTSSSDPAGSFIYGFGNVAGTCSAGGCIAYRFGANSFAVNTGSASRNVKNVQAYANFGGSNQVGGFNNLDTTLFMNAPTGNTSNAFYQAFNSVAVSNVNDGGGSGTERGSLFGIGNQAKLLTGATSWLQVISAENDISIQTGASAKFSGGASVILLSDNAVAATIENFGFLVGAQSGAVATIDCGYCFGGYQGVNPLASGATLMAFRPNQGVGSGPTITAGIDLTLFTFTGNAFGSTGFSVNGSGAISALNLNVTGSTVPTNGVYFPQANTVGIAANGAGKFYVQNTGNGYAGVNSANPINANDMLAADGSNNAIRSMTLRNVSSGNAAQEIVYLANSNSNTQGAIILNGGSFSGGCGANCLHVQNGGSDAIQINSSQVITIPAVATGTPVASLCIDASNNIIKKTTTGSCV